MQIAYFTYRGCFDSVVLIPKKNIYSGPATPHHISATPTACEWDVHMLHKAWILMPMCIKCHLNSFHVLLMSPELKHHEAGKTGGKWCFLFLFFFQCGRQILVGIFRVFGKRLVIFQAFSTCKMIL